MTSRVTVQSSTPLNTWQVSDPERLDFRLPDHLEAGEPPEARGLQRDEVRLMVSRRTTNQILHKQFRSLGEFLYPGDLIVLNTSGTLKAALNVTRADGTSLELHVSTHLPAGLYVVELRQPTEDGTTPFYSARSGDRLVLPGGAWAELLTPYRPEQRLAENQRVRLWIALLHLPQTLPAYLEKYGFPIRYRYVKESWPIAYYQTVFATEPGSAEMPSAGRAFTSDLITQLVGKGIQFAPLLLHTGVASLEDHEPPYAEYYRVPPETAQAVNQARLAGRRVIAVGTTAVRALETVAEPNGRVFPGSGWTDLIITPERGIYAIDGLLTGLHEPRSSHLQMLEALAGRQHLCLTYAEALKHNYLWHEFGDLHLILP